MALVKPHIDCAPSDLQENDPLPDLADGKPESVSPWIVGVIADDGIVRTKHHNLIACISKFNIE